MSYSTYMRLRMAFKSLNKQETAANYFLRLAKYLEKKIGTIVTINSNLNEKEN